MSEKLKVAFVVDYFPPNRIGGVGESARHLRNTLLDKGVEVIVLTAGKRGHQREEDEGIYRLTRWLLFFPFAVLIRFRKLQRLHGFNLVHMHHPIAITPFLLRGLMGKRFPAAISTFKASRVAIAESVLACLRRRIRRYAGWPSAKDWRKLFTFSGMIPFDMYLARNGHVVTANSSDTRRRIQSELLIGKVPVEVIPNGVDLDLFDHRTSGESVRQRFRLTCNHKVILYVGCFSYWKRVPLLFATLAEIQKHCSDARLLIVGAGKDKEKPYRKRAVEMGVDDKVLWAGHVENELLPEYYSAANVVVVPSYYESFGIVALEAMAMQRPVVAGRVGGIPDVVTDGEAGYLVDPLDPVEYAHKTRAILEDSTLAHGMGVLGYDTVKERNSWSAVAEMYIKAYGKALEVKKREGA